MQPYKKWNDRNQNKEFLNLEEAAKFLSLGVCTLRTACRREIDAPPFVRVGTRYLFSRSALLEWAATGGKRDGASL